MGRYFLFCAPILVLLLSMGMYSFSQNIDINQVRNSEYIRNIENKWQDTTEYVKNSIEEMKKLANKFA
ncbi:hypothetical protein GUI12_00620 [Anaplasmataceae bacterium AB001_6]|nr:hypothetical protein GUI12_00620 [Anaplasmataceae bacterium AB001_6]